VKKLVTSSDAGVLSSFVWSTIVPTACGASFWPVTVTVTVALSVAPSASVTT
jgi:hypothetical protein